MSDWFEHFGFAEVGDELVMGAYPQDADDVAALAGAGVTRVFNLVQDVEYEGGARDACVTALAEAGIEELRVELVDYGSLTPAQIEAPRTPCSRGSTRASASTCTAARAGSARRPSSPRSSRCARASRRATRSRSLRSAQADGEPAGASARGPLRWWEQRAG